ncbi:MAG: hypothetical protein ONB05_05940, partial [candidate division KSB1 bacterium]|nr:hypothetical protein [candidate division KSB1 bacterium]
SDSLWEIIDAKLDSPQTVSMKDKKRAVEEYNKGAVKLKQALALRKDLVDSLNKEIINSQIFALLMEAQKAFENSLKLNPFDMDTKSWLAKVYNNIAYRFEDIQKYEDAIVVLKDLIRVNKGEPELYYRLGINYWWLNRWPEAYENFKKAEEMLKATAFLNTSTTYFPDSVTFVKSLDTVPIDTMALFRYIYYQADTEAKMYQADKALASLKRALAIAPSTKDKERIADYLDWILWDDGNIPASEKRDYLLNLENQKEYEKAATGYRDLLKDLKTERTRDEIDWRISLLEFGYLNKKEDGIERLRKVIKKAAKDENGAPIDSTYRRYFADYGIMCHNMGVENLRKKQTKLAYIYFSQAVTIDCPNRGKSYLELAKLSINNPKELIHKCYQALDERNNLAKEEKIQAYELLVEGYKKDGNIEKAKEYFVKWKLLQQGG